MDRTTIGLMIFFVMGIVLLTVIRGLHDWKPKHENFFWAGVISPLFFTLFILPGNVDDKFINSINAMTAGAILAQYVRIKYSEKFLRIRKTFNEARQYKEKIQSEQRKKNRSNKK